LLAVFGPLANLTTSGASAPGSVAMPFRATMAADASARVVYLKRGQPVVVYGVVLVVWCKVLFFFGLRLNPAMAVAASARVVYLKWAENGNHHQPSEIAFFFTNMRV